MPIADVLRPGTEQGGTFPTALSCSPCPLLTLPESTMEAGLRGSCRVAGTGWHQCSVSCTVSRTEPANWERGLQGSRQQLWVCRAHFSPVLKVLGFRLSFQGCGIPTHSFWNPLGKRHSCIRFPLQTENQYWQKLGAWPSSMQR